MACAAATATVSSTPGLLDAASAVTGRYAPNMQSQLYSYCYSQAAASGRDPVPPSPPFSPPPDAPTSSTSGASGEENLCAHTVEDRLRSSGTVLITAVVAVCLRPFPIRIKQVNIAPCISIDNFAISSGQLGVSRARA